jgi:hypothetical protein
MPDELIEKYGLDVDNFLEHTLKEFKKWEYLHEVRLSLK